MAITEEEFKRCMAAWPSGVTVVTGCVGDKIHGMTVSDFSGASLAPPLAVVLCKRESLTTGMIAEGGCFGVSILAAGQEEVSNRFASKKLEHVRFEGVEYDVAKTGAPLLSGALANLDCRLTATHEAGDHVIFVGLIESVRIRPGTPLVYWNAGYHELAGEGE